MIEGPTCSLTLTEGRATEEATRELQVKAEEEEEEEEAASSRRANCRAAETLGRDEHCPQER